MLAGIYGGDAERLSARAVMPRLVELENEQGSLLRAFEAARSATSSPIFTSLKDGMGQMAAAIVARLGAGRLVKDCLVKEIESHGHWHIVIDNRRRQFDSVIVALPAHAAAKLLQQAAPELSRELAQIEYSSSAVVSLAYEKAHDLKIPSGFGFLVPRNQSCRLMACTFAHQKFSGRAPQGAALLRAFFGGVHDPQVIDLEDRELIAVARADLRRILGIAAEPLFMRVQRWPHAMPQYNVGHLERVARIESLLTNFSGLKLAGSAYRGIGIPDCIASARAAARELLTAANFSSANLSHATGN
jgi:oxygen-dependent protoporphyrinogen oxidase